MRVIRIVTWVLFAGIASMARADSSLVLNYAEPAKSWTDALPVGNGSMGAMVFGGVEKERIQFNHDTLWVGKPHSYAPRRGRPGSSRNTEVVVCWKAKRGRTVGAGAFHVNTTPTGAVSAVRGCVAGVFERWACREVSS